MRRRTRLLVMLGVLALSTCAVPSAWAQGGADLSVQTTGPDETTADSQIAFSITVANFGPDPADSASLLDAVPAGTTLVSFTQDTGPTFACSTPALGGTGDVMCSTASLASGAQATFTLTVHVDASTAAGTYVSDTASVSTSGADPNDENDTSTASTLVGPVTVADLGVTQDAPEARVPGSDLTYAIAVTNGGPAAAEDATMTDPLPGATTFVSITSPGGWGCTTPAVGSGGTVTCDNPSLPAGATASFQLVVHIPPATPAGTVLDNTVTVSTSGSDPNTENDQATKSTLVAAADLGVTVSAPSDAVAGASFPITITVANNGPDEAQFVEVVDPLPAGLTFVSLTQNTGPAFAAATPGLGQGGTVTLSRSPLASGATAQFTLQVAADPTTADGTVLTDAASISAFTADPDTANDSSSDATTISGLEADLGVNASGPASAKPADTLTYKLALKNDGPDSAYEVALANPVPAHTRFASVSQDSGPPFDLAKPAVGATGSVRATRAQLASGEAAAFTVKVVVETATANQTTIKDTATGSSAIHDPDASDGTASASTLVAGPGAPPVVTTPPVTPPVATPPKPHKTVVCRKVPRLKGKTFKAAKRMLKKKRCKAKLVRRGAVKRKSGKPSRVRSQKPKPGKTLYKGQKLRITLR